MDVLTGSRRYQLIRNLASGSSGCVTLCKDRLHNQNVAVKYIERGNRIDKHVLNELVNHRLLLHHHVIQFREVFLTDRHLCIVMEYASGGNMADYVNSRNGLGESEARWFFQQLIIGLDYCHRLGIANRDIKLENTLLMETTTQLLKICDFGYSKVCDHAQLKTRVGSPAYIAPEIIQIKNAHYDGKKADIWCCGVFLYTMVYASRPFNVSRDEAANETQRVRMLLQRIVDDPLVVPEAPKMSPDFYDLLLKILVKDPTKRITLDGIMNHPWFLLNLPDGAKKMNNMIQIKNSGIQTVKEIEEIFKEAQTVLRSSSSAPVEDVPEEKFKRLESL